MEAQKLTRKRKRSRSSDCQKFISKKKICFRNSRKEFDIQKRIPSIDDLPDEILTTILSSLPAKEAVRTRVVSSRWTNLCSDNLVFELDAPSRLIQVTEFVKPVNQAMALHHGPSLDKLIIRLWGTQMDAILMKPGPRQFLDCLFLDSSLIPAYIRDFYSNTNHRASLIHLICDWMRFAMRKKVRVFELASFSDNKRPSICQMDKCFCQTGRRFLHYDFPDLDKFLSISRAIEPRGNLLSSLTSFRLVNIHVKDEMIQYLLSNSPLLEELSITGSEYLSNLNIVSASLKTLSVCHCWNLKTLEISAANLLSLEYTGHPYFQPPEGVCSLNFPLLSVKLVAEDIPLKSLTLVNVGIEDEMMEYLLSSCRHLEQLCLKGTKYLSNLNIDSATLNSLSIFNCRNLKNLEISAANLLSLDYTGHPFNQQPKGVWWLNFPLLSVKLAENIPLKSLRLVNVSIEDEMMEYLLSSCRHLEQLCIKGTKYLSNLNIASATLKSLSICKCAYLKNVKISSAVNLVSLEYSEHPECLTEFCFEDVPLLSEIIIDFSYMISFMYMKKLHGIYYDQLEKLVLNLPPQALDVMSHCSDHHHFPRLRFLKQLEMSIAVIPNRSLLFCVLWAMACPSLSTLSIQLYEKPSKLSFSSEHEDEYERKRAQKELKLDSYRHKHLKVVKLMDFIGHVSYMEFAKDLLQIANSLDKLIVKPKNKPHHLPGVEMILTKDYAKNLQTFLPPGAELVMMH